MKMSVEAAPGASSKAEHESSDKTAAEESGSALPESKPQPEKIFGHEVITSEDLARIASEIKRKLGEETPQAAFEVARDLADLKRAKVGLGDRREAVLRQLDAQREQLVEQAEANPRGAVVLARYLTYRKYLGGAGKSFKMTDQEQEV
ncbi:hypothetical protein IH781_01970, partial [Patescibacteria group bacterium]|nr:hypothetical protein [Patescibacteria group bacterium]